VVSAKKLPGSSRLDRLNVSLGVLSSFRDDSYANWLKVSLAFGGLTGLTVNQNENEENEEDTH
jgi:hypothetical protein